MGYFTDRKKSRGERMIKKGYITNRKKSRGERMIKGATLTEEESYVQEWN